MTVNTSDLETGEIQCLLQHIIAPRPIALAATIDEEGGVNLSPFSFFNLFSSNPPIVIFSPARRLRNNTTKHTLDNIRQVPEVVINIVTYDIVHQASLASSEYPKGTDEFIKAGFTKVPSIFVAPPRVGEAKASLECKVNEVKSLGENGGAGQLVIAEVICIHIDDSIVTENKVDQNKIDHVARLGADWYARVSPANLFKVDKPNAHPGIGFDALPESIKSSRVLTGNHLAQLANVPCIPFTDKNFKDERFDAIVQYFKSENNLRRRIYSYVGELIDEGRIDDAWHVINSSTSVSV
jgi:flavin reductase (DIM6/NTAB) family NADH-FMN oxidoreductase RutF